MRALWVMTPLHAQRRRPRQTAGHELQAVTNILEPIPLARFKNNKRRTLLGKASGNRHRNDPTMMRSPIVSVLMLTASVSLVAQQPEHSVQFLRKGDVLFLNAVDVATALGLKLKIVRPGQLLTF